MAKQEISSLTSIRAFFSVWIMLYHYSVSSLVHVNFGNYFIQQGRFGTDFFLTLSGFIMVYTCYDRLKSPQSPAFRDFILKRFARLYPLHLLTFVIMLLFYIVLLAMGRHPQDPQEYSWESAILNLLMLHAWIPGTNHSWNYVSWTVSAEWFACIVLFAFIITLWRRMSQWQRGLLVLVLALLYNFTSPIKHLVPYALFRTSYCFLFGAWLCQLLPILPQGPSSLWKALLGGSLGLVLLLVTWPAAASWTFLITPLWGVFLLSLIRCDSILQPISAKPLLKRLGKISFSTYLTHGVISKVLFFADKNIGFLHQIQPALLLAAVVLLSLICADWVHHWVEIPAKDWVLAVGRRFFFKTASQPEPAI